jgi:hypothetical protein
MVNFDSDPLTEEEQRKMFKMSLLENRVNDVNSQDNKEDLRGKYLIGGAVLGAGVLYYGVTRDNSLITGIGYGVLIADAATGVFYQILDRLGK